VGGWVGRWEAVVAGAEVDVWADWKGAEGDGWHGVGLVVVLVVMWLVLLYGIR